MYKIYKTYICLLLIALLGITSCKNKEDINYESRKEYLISYTHTIPKSISSHIENTPAYLLDGKKLLVIIPKINTEQSKHSYYTKPNSWYLLKQHTVKNPPKIEFEENDSLIIYNGNEEKLSFYKEGKELYVNGVRVEYKPEANHFGLVVFIADREIPSEQRFNEMKLGTLSFEYTGEMDVLDAQWYKGPDPFPRSKEEALAHLRELTYRIDNPENIIKLNFETQRISFGRMFASDEEDFKFRDDTLFMRKGNEMEVPVAKLSKDKESLTFFKHSFALKSDEKDYLPFRGAQLETQRGLTTEENILDLYWLPSLEHMTATDDEVVWSNQTYLYKRAQE